MFIKETTINKLVHFPDSRIVYLVIGLFSISFVLSSAHADTTPLPSLTPTQLTATAVSPTQINLSWIAPNENFGKTIVGYKIEQRLSNGVFSTIVENTNNTITTYSLTGLQSEVTYTYRVSAVYSDGTTTDPSNTTSATLIPSTSPSTPPVSSSITNFKFDFVPSDGKILGSVIISQSDYLQLQYKKDARSVIIDAVPTNEAINNNLDELIMYQNSHLSPDQIPAPLIAKAVSATQINLSWLPPLESYGQVLVAYKIESKRSLGDYETIDDNTGNTTTRYYVTGLTPGHTYTYRVSAIYSTSTTSLPSNEASATTLAYTPPVQQPNPTQSNSSSQSPSSTTTPSQPSNVKFDFTAPDGNALSGVIISQSDYQQLVVIKDPRTLLSNVEQTSSTINNDIGGLLRYQNLHTPQESVNPQPTQTTNTNFSQIIPATPEFTIILLVIVAITSIIALVSIFTFYRLRRLSNKS